jgi:hypothetical protein
LPDPDQPRAGEGALDHREGFGKLRVGSAAKGDKLMPDLP